MGLDSRRFKELVEGGISPNSLNKVAEIAGLDSTTLRDELSKLSRLYETLCNTLQNEFTTIPCDTESDSEQGVSTGVSTRGSESAQDTDMPVSDSRYIKCAGACKRCLKCCYKVLHRYSLHASAFWLRINTYLPTLSFSQVSCERAFRKLKIIKTWLRASLENDKLETFMLMSSQNDK